MTTVRLAKHGDSQIIAEILERAFSQFRGDYTPEAFKVVTPAADEIAGRFAEGPIWIAILDERVVGTVSVLPEPDRLYIRSMAVLPEAQGQGIAQALMKAVEKYGIESGFDALFLYTTHFSLSAIHLYERLGYRRGRDTTADEWYGTPGFAMEKKLAGKTKRNAVGS